METKRPFTLLQWLDTPPAVQHYIIAIEQAIEKLSEHQQGVEKIQQGTEKQQRELEKRIEKLEARLKKNSKNSNKPPSTDDPFQKARDKGSPEDPADKGDAQEKSLEKKEAKKKKRKRGAQKGHKGHQQQMLKPTDVIPLKPERCSCGCCHFDENGMEPFFTHQQIELPKINMDVIHYILHKGRCLDCGKTVKAALPNCYQPGFGPRLTALIAEMSGILGDAREPVQRFCQSVLGFHISIGAIQKLIDRSSKAIEPIYDEIARQARQASVNNIDETSFFQGGDLRWLWVMTNPDISFYMIHEHRSKEAFLELIQDWKGTLVSDNYGVYQKWLESRQSCLAHLIRKATALAEMKEKEIRLFGQAVLAELQLLCHWAKEKPTIDDELAFVGRLVRLLLDHHDRDDEAGTLARSLLKQAKSLWTFLDVHGVEPTNTTTTLIK